MQKENRLRIERLIDGYLEERRALNWSPRTIESYRSHLKVFCDFLAMETGVEDIAAVTPATLRRYQGFLYHWADNGGRGRARRHRAGARARGAYCDVCSRGRRFHCTERGGGAAAE
jgi:site-specific recombinase XerD